MLRDAGFQIRYVTDHSFALGLSSEQQTIDQLRGAAAVIAWGEQYTKRVLSALPELRVVARAGVGVDRVDIRAATECGIVVTITPTANFEAVAEHTLALLLAIAKSIIAGDTSVRAGAWRRPALTPIRGTTLGIVGLGRIGRSLAVRALAMRMQVIATEKLPDREFADRHGIELVELDTLLARADYVSLHVPLTDETHGLIDRQRLGRMKPGSVLINTARGGLVVERDLFEALRSRQLRAAGLDVLEQEPAGAANPLFALENVVLSPHVAGDDSQAMENTATEAAECVIQLYQGQWPDAAVVNAELKRQWNWHRDD